MGGFIRYDVYWPCDSRSGNWGPSLDILGSGDSTLTHDLISLSFPFFLFSDQRCSACSSSSVVFSDEDLAISVQEDQTGKIGSLLEHPRAVSGLGSNAVTITRDPLFFCIPCKVTRSIHFFTQARKFKQRLSLYT